MRLEVLKDYLVLTKWMSFRKAAAELNVTQSALSKRIVELEKELQLTLLDRKPNSFTLTPAGLAFAEEASYIISICDEGIERCQQIQRQHLRDFKILELNQNNNAMVAVYSCAARFQSERRDCTVSFIAGIQGKPEDMLASGQVDVALGMRFGGHEEYLEALAERGLQAKPIAVEPMVIWFEKDNRSLSKLTSITFDDLRGVPVVTPAGEEAYFGNAVKELFESRGVVPRFRSLPASMSASRFFLADFRDGVFCATEGMFNDSRIQARDDLEYRIMDDPALFVTTFAMVRRDDSMARSFFDMLEPIEGSAILARE